jgi:hypothetical protein
LFYSSSAQAIITIGSGTNAFFFENAETWVDMNEEFLPGSDVKDPGYGVVSTGDYFYGILNIQNQKVNGVDVWAQDLGIGLDELDQMSGYFLTTVVSVGVEVGLADPAVHIELGAYDGVSDPYGVLSDAEIAAGGVMKLFSDDEALGGAAGPATQYSTTDGAGVGSFGGGGDIGNATDGALWATLSVTDNYWYTHAPLVPPNVGQIGWSWWGLDFIVNNTGAAFSLIDDPDETESGNILVEMYGDSKITAGTSPNWDFESDDPAVVVTPEPSSLLLLGSGMVLGAGWLRRRRKKS